MGQRQTYGKVLLLCHGTRSVCLLRPFRTTFYLFFLLYPSLPHPQCRSHLLSVLILASYIFSPMSSRYYVGDQKKLFEEAHVIPPNSASAVPPKFSGRKSVGGIGVKGCARTAGESSAGSPSSSSSSSAQDGTKAGIVTQSRVQSCQKKTGKKADAATAAPRGRGI